MHGGLMRRIAILRKVGDGRVQMHLAQRGEWESVPGLWGRACGMVDA